MRIKCLLRDNDLIYPTLKTKQKNFVFYRRCIKSYINIFNNKYKDFKISLRHKKFYAIKKFFSGNLPFLDFCKVEMFSI